MLQLPLPFFKNRAEKGDAYEKFLLDTNCSVAQRYHHHHNFKKEKIIMKKAIYRFTSPARNFCTKAGQYLRNQRGDFYISDGVKTVSYTHLRRTPDRFYPGTDRPNRPGK